MIRLEIFAVGNLKESWLRAGCEEYLKRMGLWSRVCVTELEEARLPKDPSPAQITAALEKEGQHILEKLPKNSKVVALCIEGKLLSSQELAASFGRWAEQGTGEAVFIIGGSYGLSEAVKKRDDLRLSMSPMTFPHQLARLMLCEQLYRALSILGGAKYHK